MNSSSVVKRRPPVYLLTGLALGIALGLLFGWVLSPVKYFDITPASLHEDMKLDYLTLTAYAYQDNRDIGRGYSRVSEMMSPINLNELRHMSLVMESNPDYGEGYEVVRAFLNDLQQYLNESGKQ